MHKDPNVYFFDFDSTFIQCESLETLATFALANHPQKKERLNAIHEITNLAMEGRYSYQESLEERLNLLDLTFSHLEQTVQALKSQITPSFAKHKFFFQKNAHQIYIITGAFMEIVWPLVQPFGIKREHVFANRLLYDFDKNILGYDKNNPLAQDQGKVKLACRLNLHENIVVIGDGYNDYEIKSEGYANTFIAFTENIHRASVCEMADAVVTDLEGFFITCNIPITSSYKKVLLLENIHPFVSEHFINQGFEVESIKQALTLQELNHKIKDIHILGIRSKTEITSESLAYAKELEAIGAFCIGTNQIDIKSCSQHGIAVFNAPFSNTRSVVELVIAEIILLVRKAAHSSHLLSQGIWHKTSLDAHEVRGKTLGIIGYGKIGSQLSILAEAIGMQVIFYDLEDKLPLGNAKVCHSLETLLHQADVVTIHIDGRKENHHFIGTKEFDLMKEGVIFLNLSRDSTVDYEALSHALSTQKVKGAGIDVFPEEPHESKSHYKTALQTFDNVILTPHIGGSTEEAQQNIGEYVYKNLLSYLQEGGTIGSVNLPQLNLPTLHYPQRIIHIHKNVPGILAKINSLFAQNQCNIEGQFLKTNESIGYVITDLNHEVNIQVLTQLKAIPQTIKVRIISNNK